MATGNPEDWSNTIINENGVFIGEPYTSNTSTWNHTWTSDNTNGLIIDDSEKTKELFQKFQWQYDAVNKLNVEAFNYPTFLPDFLPAEEEKQIVEEPIKDTPSIFIAIFNTKKFDFVELE